MIRFIVLLFWSVAALAQQVPATVTTVPKITGWRSDDSILGYGIPVSTTFDLAASCQYLYTVRSNTSWSGTYQSFWANADSSKGACYYKTTGGYNYMANVLPSPTCPSGSTLNSSTGLCEKRECPAEYVWVTGSSTMCEPKLPPCPGLTSRFGDSQECRCNPDNPLVSNTTGVMVGGSGSIPSTVCFRSCTFQTGFGLGGGGVWNAYLGKTTGQSCTNGIENTKPPIAKKDPPCAEGEGVMTSSQGSVVCVPPGTEGARKPVVQDTQERSEEGGVKTDKNKTTTKDPATGATTTTTTTTKTDENGNVQVSVGSVSSGAGGQGDNSGQEPGQCAKEPDSPMCRKGEPSAKGNFSGDEDAELTKVKQELKDTWAQVSSEAKSMWSGSLGSGGGSLPCPPPVVVLGKPFDICLSRYEGQLSMVGAAVMLIAALLSAFIIFRR